MGFKKYFGSYFGIVDLSDGEPKLREYGVKRVIKLGFLLGWIISNLGSYYLLGPGADFIIPTGFSTTRLVFITFILYFLLNRFKLDKIREYDEQFDWGFVYDEEKHGDKVVKKW